MAMHPSTGKQVLVEKPRRGREILTRDVPEELIDKLGIISAKREMNEDAEVVKKILSDDKKVKLKPYHEGYVNEHKYLVPDSNLEAMKTLIDFKSKRRYGRRYLQEVEPESEQDVYNRYMDKYNRMFDRIHSEVEDEEEQEEEEEIEKDEVKQEENEEEKVSEEEQIEEEKIKEESEVEEEEVENENLEEEEENEEEPIVETMPPKETPKSMDENEEVHTLQFLLSGHIRKNMKPLFIVQLYKGKSPLDIENRETLSTYAQDNIDIFISGKFFKENILEEEDNKLKCLKIEHKEIKIDERSKVYEPQLSEIFSTEDFNILVTGRFHKNQRSKTYTPVFQFKVNKKGSLNEKGQLTKNKEQQKYVGRNEPENSYKSKGDAAKGNNESVNHAMVHPTHKWAQHSPAAYFRQDISEQLSGIGDFDSARSVTSKPEIDCFTALQNNDEDFEGECPNSNNDFTKLLPTVANEKREFTNITNLNNINKKYQKHLKQKVTIYKRSALRRCVHTIVKKDSFTYFHHNYIQVNRFPEIYTSNKSHTGINVTAKKSPKYLLKTKMLSRRRKPTRQLTKIPRHNSTFNGNHPFSRFIANPSSLLQDSSTVHPEPHIAEGEQSTQRLVTSKEAQAE